MSEFGRLGPFRLNRALFSGSGQSQLGKRALPAGGMLFYINPLLLLKPRWFLEWCCDDTKRHSPGPSVQTCHTVSPLSSSAWKTAPERPPQEMLSRLKRLIPNVISDKQRFFSCHWTAWYQIVSQQVLIYLQCVSALFFTLFWYEVIILSF